MMIPKNSRNRRKQLSSHENNDVTTDKADMDASKLSAKALPTITRTSNHSTDHYSNSVNDNDSQCSWVELDFNRTTGGKGRKRTSEEKPVSHVNISKYLVDDEESCCDSHCNDSFTTSNMSEDFTDKGDLVKANDDDDESDNSVTSFGSDSYGNDVPFDDLLSESLMPSNSDLARGDNLGPVDEVPEMGTGNAGSCPPTSYRSETGVKSSSGSTSTKPESERSKVSSSTAKQQKQSKKLSSPKSKQKKKASTKSSSKNPTALQARKRLHSSDNKNGEGGEHEEIHKELKKKLSPKPKTSTSSSAIAARRRHLQQLQQETTNGGDEGASLIVDESNSSNKELKKKISPKPRRRRTRSTDGQDETICSGIVEVEGILKQESNRSLGSQHVNKRKQERHRTKSKSKNPNRKTPSRSSSDRNEEIVRNSNSKEGGDPATKRELRKRYKKKSTSGHEAEEDNNNNPEAQSGTKSRPTSTHREGKKKIRSKSNESSVEAKEKRIDRNIDARRRRKKRSSKPATPGEETVSPKPSSEQQLIEQAEDQPAEAEIMEKMTYSFHFHSEDENENNKSENWLNSNNSSSSSLSYNSFAQFSLDVGDMSGLVTDMTSLMESGLGGGNSCGFVPDLDASVQSFTSRHSENLDASVVFMAGKSSKVSLLASHSFDKDNTDDDNDKSRSARSMPIFSSDGNVVVKPEKQLRRRLKKKEGTNSGTNNNKESNSSQIDGGKSRNRKMINSEIKKRVRRAKSGGLERLKNSVLADVVSGKRGVERTKSHSEALVPGASKLVMSSAKRQERQEKSSRRKKERHSVGSSSASNKPKYAGKSKSAHCREISISPGGFENDDADIFDSSEINFSEKMVHLNDVDGDENKQSMPAVFRSPKRSPKERHVRRTISNPGPSSSIHAVGPSIASDFGDHSISPMSFGSSPVNLDGAKKPRRPSISRQALLAGDDDDDEEDNYMSDTCYSPASMNVKKRSFLPKRGIERTPSSLLAGVRNHFKESNTREKMLSKMKKTFSVSGRGKDTFGNSTSSFDDISIGMTTEKGYIGTKERRRLLAESAGRRGQVKNSLYACMSDDDSSVEISSEMFVDDSDDSVHDNESASYNNNSLHSFKPKRIQSLSADKCSASDGPERAGPRRINSLPIGIRRLPNS